MTAHEKYRMPEGVRVICGFPGIGKSMLNQQNLSFVDLNLPLQDESEIDRVRQALKIPGVTVMLPIWLTTRRALHAAGIPYVVFYPSRDLRADYHKRLSDRGDPEIKVDHIFMNWNAYITACVADPTPHKVEMRQSQARLSDYFL
jgi:hypothetical protein